MCLGDGLLTMVMRCDDGFDDDGNWFMVLMIATGCDDSSAS